MSGLRRVVRAVVLGRRAERGVSGLRHVVRAVVLAGALALPLSAATPTPEPTETAPAPPLPEEVSEWFGSEALAAVAEAGVAAEFEVGRPRQVTTWSTAFVAGDSRVDPVASLDEWVAPVVEPGEEDGEPAGVAVVRAADPLELVEVDPDPELAGALADLALGATVVFDPAVAGWFALADGEVWPITAEARTVLQGSLSVDVFQSFLSERMGVVTSTPEPVEEVPEEESLAPLVAIGVIVVLGAGAAWLLVRQYRRTDSRIVADVHAGVSPPRHEGPDEEPGR